MSAAAQDALARSHTITARATVTSPLGTTLQLPVAGGEVTVDAGSAVRRTATIEVDPRFWPVSPLDLLAPFGSEAVLEYGIGLPDRTIEWIPLGVFRLDTSTREKPYSGSGAISVALVDRSAAVAEDIFDTPTQTVSGATHVAEITRLIQRTLGTGQAVNDTTGSTQVAPITELDKDPWSDGVEKLATAIGAEVFFDQLGVAQIRPQPTLDNSPVWMVSTGDYGTLIKVTERLTRKDVYNRVIASGQRSDGTTPVFAAVSDTNIKSPTYYGGPFGRKPRRYSSPLLTTVAQCTTTATALLARVLGTGVQLDMQGLVNPALDAGDVITAVRGNTRTVHILDKVNIPLTPDGVQQLGTRSLDWPDDTT